MNLQIAISAKIKDIYDFHEYQISKDNLIQLTNIIVEIKPDVDLEYFERFLKAVYMGKYGILYKMPTCLIAMFQKYIDDHRQKLSI